MKRRAFVIAMALSTMASHASAQTDASRTQIDLALAAASLAALLTRYGESYPDVVTARARIATLTQSLRQAQARHESIDVALVTTTLEGELADVRTRLGESSVHCGSAHPEMESARAREVALETAIQHVTSDGFYVP